jgi:uncharacterized protein YhaN
MRIERLDLERYGHFTDHHLDFSGPDVRLHIVHGANEAGKSTALSAICDLLFGVPERTRLGFRHGNNALRIGAVLRQPDGSVLEVKRRKGRQNTLLAADGSTALGDGTLAPLLGGIDRGQFERLFGLDHARLRAGGEAMLAAGGDLARTLFQAGSGLTGIADIMAGLQADADRLGGPHKRQGSKPLYEALDAYQAATARMRNEATKAEAWEAAEKRLADARAALAGLQKELETAQRAQSRLERIRRVRPLLARLETLAAERAELGAGPDLPAPLAEQWNAAQSRLLQADRHRQQAAQQLETALKALAEAGEPPLLPALAAEIEALFQRAGSVQKARTDLPRRQRELEMADERLGLLAARLGRHATPEALEQAQPGRVLAARIREKVAIHGRLDGARDAAAKREMLAERSLSDLADAAGETDAAGDPLAAEAALAAALRLGEVEKRLDEAAREAEARTDDLAVALARLGRFTGTAEALAKLALPDLPVIEGWTARLNDLAQKQAKLLDALAQAMADERKHAATLAELAADGEVPTLAAIEEARRQRDGAWQAIRRRILEKLDVPVAEWSSLGLGDAPAPRFEATVRAADQLADRRDREAQRVSRHARASSDLAEARARREALERDRNDLTTEVQKREAEWQGLWRASGFEAAEPVVMAGWRRQVDSVLALHRQSQEAARKMAGLVEEAARCANHLRDAMQLAGCPAAAGETELSRLRARADAAVKACREQTDKREKRRQEQARAERALRDAQREKAEAAEALAAWADGWASDMTALRLPTGTSPAEAEAALGAWEDIGQELRTRHELAHRIDGLLQDIKQFNDDLNILVEKAVALDPALGLEAGDPDAASRLLTSLDAARQRETRRGLLADATEKARRADEAATRELAEALAEREDLQQLYGLEPGDDVPALVALASRRRTVLKAEQAALAELAQAGDGHSRTTLETEAAGLDPDGAAAELAAVGQEIARLQAALPQVSSDLRDAERALDELRERSGIGEAAQEAAAAEAKAAQHAARWLRLRAAGLLLTQAVERYRNRNEHPLLRRASAILALMAASGGNPVTHLKVDYGDGDHPVLLGVRRDGSDAQVQDMSEGLRDQLFLALRIAAVEAHVAQASPLPFIADDLFITSDEPRTAAGLAALAELGASTQVVLFTHHRYVLDAAQGLTGVRVHELVGAA